MGTGIRRRCRVPAVGSQLDTPALEVELAVDRIRPLVLLLALELHAIQDAEQLGQLLDRVENPRY